MQVQVLSDDLSVGQPTVEEVEDLTGALDAGQLLPWSDGNLVFRVVKPKRPDTARVVIVADDGEPAIIDRKDYESARRRMQ